MSQTAKLLRHRIHDSFGALPAPTKPVFNDNIEIEVSMDTRNAGAPWKPGAAPTYYVITTEANNPGATEILGSLRFQEGDPAVSGVNGITMEALLAIVENRLRFFQQGPFGCSENEEAINAIGAALEALHRRTLRMTGQATGPVILPDAAKELQEAWNNAGAPVTEYSGTAGGGMSDPDYHREEANLGTPKDPADAIAEETQETGKPPENPPQEAPEITANEPAKEEVTEPNQPST